MRARGSQFVDSNSHSAQHPQTTCVRGRMDRVQGVVRVGARDYWALERLGGSGREIWRVFDPQAGPEGDFRVLHRLPNSAVGAQRIEVLRRTSEGNLHLAKFVDFHQTQDEMLVVMNWVWGTPLDEYLQQVRTGRAARPSVPEATRLVRGLAHGVSHLHVKASVVHGDIKPANLIVTRDPYQLVLIDFGSAWPVEQTSRRQPGDGRSAPYAAPEQFQEGAAVNFQADMFAVSVVWHELLTGEIPYRGLGGLAGLAEYQDADGHKLAPVRPHCVERHPLPRQAWPILERTLARGLALSSGDRFASRQEWLDAMDELHHWLRRGTGQPQEKNWLARGLAWLQERLARWSESPRR